MRATDNFRRQHRELLGHATELMSLLRPSTVRSEAPTVLRELSRFAGRLRVHAAMENEALYPRLLESDDARVRDKARGMLDELGGLYADFDGFMQRWREPASLEQAPERFAEETVEMLRKLGARMMRENTELYPLVDAHDAGA